LDDTQKLAHKEAAWLLLLLLLLLLSWVNRRTAR